MILRSRNLSVFWCLAAAALLLAGVPGNAWARRVDVEAGVGAMFFLEEDQPVNDDVYYGVGAAIQLLDQLDLEFSAARGEGNVNPKITQADVDAGTIPHKEFRAIYHGMFGLRLYPFQGPDKTARFYLAAGGSIMSGLQGDGVENWGFYVGPGARLRAGDHSGFTIKLPMVVSVEGDTDSMLIPSLNFFYEF
jgi:hypothetical protein